MKKIIIIAGVLLTTSCGMFSKMTEKEKELQYQIDKAYFEYSHKRDSLILEHYRKQYGRVDNIDINNYYDWQLFTKRIITN